MRLKFLNKEEIELLGQQKCVELILGFGLFIICCNLVVSSLRVWIDWIEDVCGSQWIRSVVLRKLKQIQNCNTALVQFI